MAESTHTLPPGHVQQLVPQGSGEIAMTPDREVLCLHRGTEPYEDMFDGRPYLIAPGYFMTQLGAALHFRARAVVPGTRNPETQRQASFLVIVGAVEFLPDGRFHVLKAVDKPEEWTPFTAEERAEYETKQEALDRDGMVNPIDAAVDILPTSGVIAGRGGKTGPPKSPRLSGGAVRTGSRVTGGTGRRVAGHGPDIEATDERVLESIPPDENQVLKEAQRAAAEAEADGHRSR